MAGTIDEERPEQTGYPRRRVEPPRRPLFPASYRFPGLREYPKKALTELITGKWSFDDLQKAMGVRNAAAYAEGSSTGGIQEAINQVISDGGGVAFVPKKAGNYQVTSDGEKCIGITGDNVIVWLADGVVIEKTDAALDPVFLTYGSLTAIIKTIAASAEGSKSVTVNNVTDLAVGDYVQIRHDTDYPNSPGTDESEVNRIQAIVGNVLTMEIPLQRAYDGANPQVIKMAPIKNSGVMGPGIIDAGNTGRGVWFQYAVDCFVGDVTVENWKNIAFGFYEACMGCYGRDLIARDPDAVTPGEGYGFLCGRGSAFNTFENIYGVGCRHTAIVNTGAHHNVYDGIKSITADGVSTDAVNTHGNEACDNQFSNIMAVGGARGIYLADPRNIVDHFEVVACTGPGLRLDNRNDYGEQARPDRAKVSNGIIRKAGTNAILVEGGNRAVISNVLCEENLSGSAVWVNETEGAILRLTLDKIEVVNASGDAFSIDVATEVKIIDPIVFNPGSRAFDLATQGNVVIENPRVHMNGAGTQFVYVNGGDNIRILNPEVTNGAGGTYGVVFNNTLDSSIVGGKIEGAGWTDSLRLTATNPGDTDDIILVGINLPQGISTDAEVTRGAHTTEAALIET